MIILQKKTFRNVFSAKHFLKLLTKTLRNVFFIKLIVKKRFHNVFTKLLKKRLRKLFFLLIDC
jgi:hypothetical protein